LLIINGKFVKEFICFRSGDQTAAEATVGGTVASAYS